MVERYTGLPMAEGPEAYVARVYVQVSAAIYIGVDKRRQRREKQKKDNNPSQMDQVFSSSSSFVFCLLSFLGTTIKPSR